MTRSRPDEYRPGFGPLRRYLRPGLRLLLHYLLLPVAVAAALATAGTWLLHQWPGALRAVGSLADAFEGILAVWLYMRLQLDVFGAALGLLVLSCLLPIRWRPAAQWAIALAYAGVGAYLAYGLQVYRHLEVWLWLTSGLLGLLLPWWLERRAA
ncbi:hypothetical protein [Hymenobacter jeollabukensis]|uniref:Uncharacterized protein n=1 Tax=Hymenobacter jeollabukensis TaxID=2025313 RepID=A0A5R8WKF6_9BACT|nr:hypothetical protein [Hymenobacter jeollabukensis]TLM89512.1 hypothetical protein FDY95_20790 [Hymenobacter jeollabukensis]